MGCRRQGLLVCLLEIDAGGQIIRGRTHIPVTKDKESDLL